MRRAVQWQNHCHSCFAAVGVGAGGVGAEAGAIRIFCDTKIL